MYETAVKAAQIISTAHPVMRGICRCNIDGIPTHAVSDVLLESGWDSVMVVSEGKKETLYVANTSVAREEFLQTVSGKCVEIYRKESDGHRITESWPVK